MTNLKAALAELVAANDHHKQCLRDPLSHAVSSGIKLDAALEKARAALQEAEPAAAEGQAGWRWVPVEPSEQMLDAGRGFDFGPGNGSDEDASAERVWAAMLAAAPLPSGQQEGGKG